ncbi:Cupin 2 conserved barrel domain protein [Solidesulfovibrio carbinoliphilus subsp. oakridgensis]|uniref:Cupin 2 conserved barrel domain protein n=1 Tax=Solidesulfovibrio carbinoliphilus subsp. oakridgensis TaxID=694327 RepID=G7QCB1_9BACT|nr:XRE family transcriptional regulator [Solidesulfovibrio carbinoliphilus]EHJ46067.1 Cupin 2 conserved barrel domain protein [Solidesulfovibrio carbinoliphilus subsp. oakridgensis]
MSKEIGPVREIAMRLRGIREVTGFSAEALAEATGVSPAQVLQYETGETEIPVSYLYEVAKACGVDLTALLTGDEAHLLAYSLVPAGQGLSVDRRKAYKYQALAYRFHKPSMEPFIVTVPAKQESELEFNRHLGEEFIYMLRGRLEVRLGDDVVTLNPHDSLYFSSRTPHAMRGLDGEEAEFLDVII